MQIAVLASQQQKESIQKEEWSGRHDFIWADSLRSLLIIEADLFIDLQFVYERERIAGLIKLFPKPVLVSPISHTNWEFLPSFIRINASPIRIKYELDALEKSLTGVKHRT
ncbi:MAG TPA: hypothetical protein VK628_01160 [Flavitalea sp.]|nr:hypothetical protein [Flavitalea sp.]